MLFRKNIERSCAYCKFSADIDENACLCRKKGVVARNGACRRFRYDPLRRVPQGAAPKDFSQFDGVDFSL